MDNTPYKIRCEQCNLIPLTLLREQYDLMFLYSYIHGKFNMDVKNLFNFDIRVRQTRLADADLLLQIPRVHNTILREWYTVRVCHLWNKLSNELRSIRPGLNAQTLNLRFKHEINTVLNEAFNTKFAVYDICTWRYRCGCHTCRTINR